ncbi:MAG: hypothetical protein OXI74_04040 [Rhodospirillaceae bacterium]|nr:hypothetical protein [Rhodospirillaceae bacterium]
MIAARTTEAEDAFMDQRMGRHSEDTFKQQCSLARITCNKSLEDDHGWDYLVEIPMVAPAGTPEDKLPPVTSTLVQVKSTRAARPRLAMKVSNAHQLATRSEPCVLVLYHESQEGTRIYARLFNEKDITRTLKRCRELFVARTPTHKARISFGFSASEDHTSDLIQWVKKTVQELPDDYSNGKKKLATTVGYESKGYQANITFVAPRGIDDLVDLELGIKEELEVSRFTMFDMRFGIQAPDPIHHHEEPGILRIEPTRDIDCIVTLETNEDSISIPSKARISVARGTAPEQIKLAFLNSFFHIVVGMNDGIRFTLQDVASKKLSIEELSQLATMFSWSDQQITIRVTGDGTPKTNIPTARVTPNPDAWDRKLALAIRMLGDAARRGQSTDLTLTMDEVISAHPPLEFYYDLLTADQASVHITAIDPPIDPKLLKNLIGYVDVQVGKYTLFTLFDCAIETRVDEHGNLFAEFGQRNIRDCVVGTDRENVLARGQAIYDQCGGGYGDDWLAIGSFNAVVESSRPPS